MFAANPKKIILSATLTLSFIITSCQGKNIPTEAPEKDLLAKILARGTIVVATDPAYPPQSELIAGATRVANTKCSANEYTSAEIDGYDVATAVEVAKRLGVEACFVTPPWSRIISGRWDGRWDISIGSMGITPERLKVLYFTQPYTAGPSVLFVNKDNTSFSKPGDLSGKRGR